MAFSLYKTVIIVGVICGLILPNFSLSQEMTPPATFGKAKEMALRILKVIKEKFPARIAQIWKEEVLPVWQKMDDWFKKNIWPKIESWFKKEFQPRAKEEIEKRKPLIEEEFKKEKEEMKEEVPKVTKSLWEKFKELIK